jgi:hypothetical protein
VGFIELVNAAMPAARGCLGDTFASDGGDIKNGLVASVDWKHGIWVDAYSCLDLYSRTQVGYCQTDNLLFLYICI